MIKIVCRKPGFRRAGVAHPAEQTYAAGRFTAEQMRALKAETNLVVVALPDVPAPKPDGKAKG
jgi:hypothetical protein